MKTRSVLVLVALSLCWLNGCGTSSSTPASSPTPKATQTTLPSPTTMPSPTPTTDRDPFQVNFLQHYQLVTCPSEPNPTTLCYTLQDDPSASSLGKISFAGTDILYMRSAGSNCGPAERSGALKLGSGDTITIHAMGTYCVPGYPVQFTFTVTGGTGTYRHATGGGTIAVGPARNTPPTADEFWSGTIRRS